MKGRFGDTWILTFKVGSWPALDACDSALAVRGTKECVPALSALLVDERLAAPMTADANDFLWAWGSSADYDAEPGLEKIKATVLAINAADDERNPPETGVTERALKRLKNAKLHLIPASEETSGHGTTGNARFYKQQLQELLDTAPRQAM